MNLLLNEACQPWDNIVKEQVNTTQWKDPKGGVHQSNRSKTQKSFLNCEIFHLLTVLHHDAAEAVKYYITNILEKPNRVPDQQIFVHVEQLNNYLEPLPCLYNSPNLNFATKPVVPLNDANLAIHLLQMCLVNWQRQQNLMEISTLISTRALLLVLKNIKSNVKLDDKPPNKDKTVG